MALPLLNATSTHTTTTASPWPLSSPLWHITPLDILILVPLLIVICTTTIPALLDRLVAPTPPSTPHSAYVVPAFTRHARFLPTASQHRFHYTTLYLAARLDHLETHAIDTGHAFAWRGNHLDTEWQDQAHLAAQHTVASHSPSSSAPSPSPSTPTTIEQWKRGMRTAERNQRRSTTEKHRRLDAATWSLLALHPSSYLRNHLPATLPAAKQRWITGSILLKLAYELRERGHLSTGPQDDDGHGGASSAWTRELGQVWSVTMPAAFGMRGINPLTVHYCYRPAPAPSGGEGEGEGEERLGAFWLVVLEVHNTFEERHVYILESGVGEDSNGVRPGYDHQWTFPRSFHVSPFNDRGGFYRLFLREPFPRGEEGRGTASPFVLGIRLLLLVDNDDDPAARGQGRLQKKLMATLDSYPSTHSRRVRPFCASTVYAALLRQPLDLFLTFSRILWEAGKLHFSKRLDAFGRPDMVQPWEEARGESTDKGEGEGEGGDRWDGTGFPPPLNAIQPHRAGRQGGRKGGENDGAVKAAGLLYPPLGAGELVAKRALERFARERVEALHRLATATAPGSASTAIEGDGKREIGERWHFKVISTDPSDEGIDVVFPPFPPDQHHDDDDGLRQRKLTLYTRSGGVYTDLLLFEDVRVARIVGSLAGRRWGVDDVGVFERFFRPDPISSSSPSPSTGTLAATGRGESAKAARSYIAHLSATVRRRHLRYLISCATRDQTKESFIMPTDADLSLPSPPPSGHPTPRPDDRTPPSSTPNPLDGPNPPLSHLLTLLSLHLASVVEERAFAILGARYVGGTEPWLELKRGMGAWRGGVERGGMEVKG